MIVRRIESKSALRKKRVAAYTRVSTEAEEQQESLRTQLEYYETFIRQNPTWEYVKVYADPAGVVPAQSIARSFNRWSLTRKLES